MNFESLNLKPEILVALQEKGYTDPTTIQVNAIPLLLSGVDVLAKSQTGSGKTAAFGIPAISMITKEKHTQVLILCPTRELCIQVSDELKSFANKLSGVNVVSIYGGEPFETQLRRLKKGKQIIVATPGRLMDHLRRKTINLSKCQFVVLDEADEMLNMGFIEDIETIFTYLPEDKQIALFSATIPSAIQSLSKRYLKDATIIDVAPTKTNNQIEQLYYVVQNQDKDALIVQLLQMYDPKSTMVFCNTKKKVDELTTYLNNAGFSASSLHGDMKQEMRSMVMNRFKKGDVSILIATDVAARGIDVANMDLVINYDVPQELEYYIHRIGRTGRAGNEGLAITLIGRRQLNALRQIERHTKVKLTQKDLPTKDELNTLLVKKLIKDIKAWSTTETNQNLLTVAYNGLRKAKISQEDIILAFINKSIDEYSLEAIKPTKIKNMATPSSFTTLNLNVGKKDNVTPAAILRAIMDKAPIKKNMVGKITIGTRSSKVDIASDQVRTVMKAIHGTKIKGIKIKVNKVD